MLSLLQSEPVAGPDSGAARAGDAADPGGGEGREPAVRDGLSCELAQGGEREVDRDGREPALDEVRALTPENGPGKALSGGVCRVPVEELPQSLAIRPAGVLARQRV